LAGYVTNGGGKLGDERQMLLLPARPGVRTPAEGSHQRPVVCENGEGASLQHEAEVFDGGYYGKKLPIESAVVDLSLIQLG
jgi:hypothetical protein